MLDDLWASALDRARRIVEADRGVPTRTDEGQEETG